MKTIYTKILLVAFVAGLAACSGKPETKTAQLEVLKKEQADLAKKITSLEKEIAKENPADAKVKMKEIAVQEIAARPFDHFVKHRQRFSPSTTFK